MMVIKYYRDLTIWKDSIELVTRVYELTRKLPQYENYGLSSQLQRAAVSIPSNIAEGHARKTNKEFNRFLSISLGSLAELETQMTITEKLLYLSSDEVQNILERTSKIGKMIRNLQKKVMAGNQ